MIASLMKKIKAWLRARVASAPLRIVAARPLHGGTAVYVADIDGRRLVFAVGGSGICLLASYQTMAAHDSGREEEAAQRRAETHYKMTKEMLSV